jgi:transposase
MYQDGLSIRGVAAATGMDRNAVQWVLRRAKVTMRPPGGRPPRSSKADVSSDLKRSENAAVLNAVKERVCALYRQGESIRSIMQTTGKSYGTIHRWLVANGVKLRARGRPKAG